MSAHSYIYVTIFYFLNYLFFKKKIIIFFLEMMLTYHISHEKIFSTALYVHGRSGVNGQNGQSCQEICKCNNIHLFMINGHKF